MHLASKSSNKWLVQQKADEAHYSPGGGGGGGLFLKNQSDQIGSDVFSLHLLLPLKEELAVFTLRNG